MNSLDHPTTTPSPGTEGYGTPATISARRQAFRALHETGCFVMPNPWDVGSAALGVRRISVGGALALAAWTGFTRAAQMLTSRGSFAGLASLVPYGEINDFFASDYRARET